MGDALEDICPACGRTIEDDDEWTLRNGRLWHVHCEKIYGILNQGEPQGEQL